MQESLDNITHTTARPATASYRQILNVIVDHNQRFGIANEIQADHRLETLICGIRRYCQ